jgi:hypothetical protein
MPWEGVPGQGSSVGGKINPVQDCTREAVYYDDSAKILLWIPTGKPVELCLRIREDCDIETLK